ncbi:hypothetical protein BGZ94_003261 [Podila epigama]|nr:hypothetical protein BGZ94_003261 [Podila epigama]
MNRLKSIQADAAFVNEIADLFPQYPILANERCGTWYVHPSKIHRPGVYFKSTDGHTSIWDFNLRRYNPHLLTLIIQHGGCIIVDSTRKGKRVPDALSKTIPIWCATINNAVQKRAQLDRDNQTRGGQIHGHESQAALVSTSADKENKTYNNAEDPTTDSQSTLLVPALDSTRWDTRYHSLPSLISRSEHAQIAEKIDGFAEKLLRFTDLTPLTTKLVKPIRPIWYTPQSIIFKEDLPDYSQVGFSPVICLSASRVVPDGMEERDGYLYVQGSGDDEEMWSKGLRPDLFWENVDWLLEDGISPAECEERAKIVVQQAKAKELEQSRHDPNTTTTGRNQKRQGASVDGHIYFTPSMELCSEIKPSPIWIGNNASGKIPDGWEAGFDMVINCAAEIQRDPIFERVNASAGHVVALGGSGQGGAQATLCILQRYQWDLAQQTPSPAPDTANEVAAGTNITTRTVLPPNEDGGREYYYVHLPIAEGKKGQHHLFAMIPMAIKAMNEMYDRQVLQQESSGGQPRPLKILVHCQQGMDRSVGISLALLVACFEEAEGRYVPRTGSSLHGMTASKEIIQRRLFQIMSHRLAARPSRATLKMVNTFFMSPTDPPPAMYKS